MSETTMPRRLAAAGARLDVVTAPALVLWGDRDPYLAPHYADAVAAALGRAEVVHLPGARHWPWLEQPEAVERVVQFLLR